MFETEILIVHLRAVHRLKPVDCSLRILRLKVSDDNYRAKSVFSGTQMIFQALVAYPALANSSAVALPMPLAAPTANVKYRVIDLVVPYSQTCDHHDFVFAPVHVFEQVNVLNR